MSYSPAALPVACPDCGFLDCKCYLDQHIETSSTIEYDPSSTEPEADFETKPFVDELDLSNDGYEMFEMNEAFGFWGEI